MTKHTPGPWTYGYISSPTRHFRVVIGPCHARSDELTVGAGGGTDEIHAVDEANARLIAAAPDLLAACEAQHKAIDTLFARLIALDIHFMPSKSGACWDACLAGNAAITKAMGEQS